MPVISFGKGVEDDWFVARWAFRGLLKRTLELSHDVDAQEKLGVALAVDGLHFPDMAPGLVAKIAPALRKAIGDITSGDYKVEVEGRVLDDVSQAQFRNAVRALEPLVLRCLAGQ